jgi:hypothetical protein
VQFDFRLFQQYLPNYGSEVLAHLRERHRLVVHAQFERSWDRYRLRPCGPRTTEERGWSIGANAMRSVLAFGLLIALCASANAARVHHSKPRHVTVRPSQGVDPRFPPVLQDQTPSYDDPSKFGGG